MPGNKSPAKLKGCTSALSGYSALRLNLRIQKMASNCIFVPFDIFRAMCVWPPNVNGRFLIAL